MKAMRLLAFCLGIAAGTSLYGSQSITVSAGHPFRAISFPQSTQNFTVHLLAVFSNNANQGIALTQGSTQNADQFAVAVRADGNMVQAANSSGFPATGLPFTPGAPMDLIVSGNMAQRVFSVWLAPRGRRYTMLAADFGFRSGNQPAYLDTVMVWADSGTVSVTLGERACVENPSVPVRGRACTSPSYDQTVLADHPVAYWSVSAQDPAEVDLTGNGSNGSYPKGLPASIGMPNGDQAGDFNGRSQYLTIASSAGFSIPTTGNLTWEAWIRPDVLQFPNENPDGYVEFLGKCANFSPTCEWEARMYSSQTRETPNRPNRLSAYVFNPTAGLGSGADWQPDPGVIQAGQWFHVVGEYTVQSAPAACQNTAGFPGSINIWVNGVEWNQSRHGQTGCLGQFSVRPQAGSSPLNIGTMALDSYFAGAIGKVAIYNYLLTPAQIGAHYQSMTGQKPQGSCSDTCKF